jgi:uncharacterized delta-60 repeat protein
MSLMTLPASCRLRFPFASAPPVSAVLRWLRVTVLLSAILGATPAASAQIAGQLDPLNAKIVGTYVRTVVLQPDGKMIIAGEFTSVQDTPRSNIARLNPDGSLDTAFDVGTNSWIYSVVVQPDGKILLGGNFISVKPAGSAASVSRRYMARLLPDGRLDPDFNPSPNGDVTSIALQPDGWIICGGFFTSFGLPGDPAPVAREHLARLEPSGGVDLLFNLPVQAFVYCIALQPNGAFLVGGRIPGAGSTFGPGYIFRVNADLTLDQTFSPLVNGYVNSIAIQPDGRIILGGAFNAYRADLMTPPVTRCYILRLFATGLLDQAFNPNPNGIVECLAVQTDNRILMGGTFNTLQPPNTATPADRQHLARVNADGSVDFTFTPKTDNDVTSIALQMDGRILVGGYFSVFLPGSGRKFFARLSNGDHTQTITQTAPAQVLWERIGALPEVEEVVFEQSTDGGANWSLLGIPTRVAGTPASWEYAAADPVADGTLLRARAVSSPGNRGYGRLEFPVPDSLTSRQEWNQTWFGSSSGTGDAASDADPNGNGIANLLEYALGGDPVGDTTGTAILPQVSTEASGLLQLAFQRYPDRDDITIVIQAADNAATGPWEDFASSVNGTPFALLLPGYAVSETGSGASRDVICTDKPGGASPLRFLRIKVTES